MKIQISLLFAILFVHTKSQECDPALIQEIRNYRPVAELIIEEILHGASKGLCYEKLAEFVDSYQLRITGSQVLEDSIDYLLEQYQGERSVMDNTWKESVPNLPYWTRLVIFLCL